jgi:hypothetical protein
VNLVDIFDGPTAPRNISNSEVTSYLSCKRQYEFAFIDELEPINTSTPLARGNTFHLGMEYYWKARLNGASHTQAMDVALEAFGIVPEGMTLVQVMEAQTLWMRYMTFHAGFPDIKPLGTEQQYDLPLTSTLNMTIRYDLYFQNIKTGRIAILDYKTTYDFWSHEDHEINAQMPKYIACMQANGMQVDEGFLEEIRTRPLGPEKAADPKNLWKTTPYRPSSAKKKAVLQQHIGASLEIEKHRALDELERKMVSYPVLNKHGACKYCNFKNLCISMLDGKTDLTVDKRVGYVKNRTYGYNREDTPNVGF